MPISMYQASIPLLVRSLTNLRAILDKGLAHAEARKIDPAVFINARLFPDMLPLLRQVQIATDMAKGCAARLAGVQPPRYADEETTFAELDERIASVVEYLESFRAEQIDGTEEKTISLPMLGETLTFNGLDYLRDFVLPNVFFHVTTAYNILRHGGVELGKADFLGKF